jgi:hypothetical protein
MKKLITPNEKLKELDNSFLKGEITIHKFRIKMMEYFTFLDQQLTESMFVGDKAIFVGFRKGRDLMEHVFTNNELNVKILFMNDGTCIECIDSFGYLENFAIKEAKIHDLAELTKEIN